MHESSPVFGGGLLFVASGKAGPLIALRTTGDDGEPKVAWSNPTGGPYVCSPILVDKRLYVHNEQGVLVCYDAASGAVMYRERLKGKFIASAVATIGPANDATKPNEPLSRIYLTNEEGVTSVVAPGSQFHLLAENSLGESCLASPAVAGDALLIRGENHLYCIGQLK